MRSVGMKIPCYCPLTSMQGDWYSAGLDGFFFFFLLLGLFLFVIYLPGN